MRGLLLLLCALSGCASEASSSSSSDSSQAGDAPSSASATSSPRTLSSSRPSASAAIAPAPAYSGPPEYAVPLGDLKDFGDRVRWTKARWGVPEAVQVADLAKQYTENAVAADAKYLNKGFTIIDLALRVGKTDKGQVWLAIDGVEPPRGAEQTTGEKLSEMQASTVFCDLTDEKFTSEWVAEVKRYDIVSVACEKFEGKKSGHDLIHAGGDFRASGCVLLRAPDKPEKKAN